MYNFQLLSFLPLFAVSGYRILLSATYFPSIRSLSRCILFLPLVAYPLILPLIMEIKMILQMTEVGEGVLSVREHPIMPNVRMLNEGSECQMTKYG